MMVELKKGYTAEEIFEEAVPQGLWIAKADVTEEDGREKKMKKWNDGRKSGKDGDSRTGETPKADNTADTGRC